MTTVSLSSALGDYLGLALDRLGDGITVQDPTGALVYANESGARLIGFESVEELLRTPVEEVVSRFELLDEEDRPMVVDDLPGRCALRGEYPPEVLIQVRSRSAATVRWSVVQALPVLNDAGEVIYAVNLFRDVTERVETDHRLRFLVEERERLLEREQEARAQAERVAESLRQARAHHAGGPQPRRRRGPAGRAPPSDHARPRGGHERDSPPRRRTASSSQSGRPTASTARSRRRCRSLSERGWPGAWPPARSRS